MKVLFGLAIGLLATQLGAQTASDETAIRSIVQDEIAAWNRGDAGTARPGAMASKVQGASRRNGRCRYGTAFLEGCRFSLAHSDAQPDRHTES